VSVIAGPSATRQVERHGSRARGLDYGFRHVADAVALAEITAGLSKRNSERFFRRWEPRLP